MKVKVRCPICGEYEIDIIENPIGAIDFEGECCTRCLEDGIVVSKEFLEDGSSVQPLYAVGR